MIQHFFYAMILTLFASPLVAQDNQKSDEAAIRQILSTYVNAYNDHDSKTMASFWAEDGDLINPWGQLATSRAEVEKIFKENDEGRLKKSTINESIEYIRFITPEVVLVDVDRVISNMLDESGKALEPFSNHGLYVLAKRNGKWQIVAFRAYASGAIN